MMIKKNVYYNQQKITKNVGYNKQNDNPNLKKYHKL